MKKLLFMILLFSSGFVLLLFLLFGNNDEYSRGKTNTHNSIIKDPKSSIKEYFEKNSFYKIIDITKEDNRIVGVPNYCQDSLNNAYKSEKGTEITGTCTIVAILDLLYFYDMIDSNYSINDSNEKETFNKVFEECYKKGYVSLTNGVADGYEDDCFDIAFGLYGSDREGNTNWYNLYGNMTDSLRYGSPILFGLIDHATVFCGFANYTMTYELTGPFSIFKNSPRMHFDFEYAILKPGWDKKLVMDDGYFSIENITNHNDGFIVTWAEK